MGWPREQRPEIRVVLDEGAYLPERAHDTDAGADLRTPVAFTVPARGSAVVRTGVHVETPANCVAMVKGKSGLNIRRGITCDGVIDEGFTGEVVVRLYNHARTPHSFERGDKITQLVVMPVLYPADVESGSISGGEPGDAGCGSTGR